MKWNGIVEVCTIAEQIFNVSSVLVNDANAAALGEMKYGVAKDWNHFVCITLGTGLGSGVIINGELVTGHQGLAGEFGHVVVEPKGRPCGCGRNGCLETYASSTGVMKSYKMASELKPSLFVGLPKDISAQNIFEFAKDGHEGCLEIVDSTAEYLGQAPSNFACFSDPQGFVLFGGLAHSASSSGTKWRLFSGETV